MKARLMNLVKKAWEGLKKNLLGVKDYMTVLPWYGKIGLVVIFLFVNFVLPNVLFMPPLIRWCNKQYEKKCAK